jgi:trigger factor
MTQVVKTKLSDTKLELTVTVPYADLSVYLDKAAAKLSEHIKLEGFRPGKVPLDIMKRQVGDLALLEEAAKLLIDRTASKTVAEHIKDEDVIGQPQLAITKLSPDQDLEYKISIDTLPVIKLQSYQGFDIKAETVSVSDEEFTKALDQLLDMQAEEKVSDKELALGDKTLVDIKMYLDSVPVDGGQAKGVSVILGKNYVVPLLHRLICGPPQSN